MISSYVVCYSYAEQTGSWCLCMRAAGYYWNACVPLLNTRQNREQLKTTLELILQAVRNIYTKHVTVRQQRTHHSVIIPMVVCFSLTYLSTFNLYMKYVLCKVVNIFTFLWFILLFLLLMSSFSLIFTVRCWCHKTSVVFYCVFRAHKVRWYQKWRGPELWYTHQISQVRLIWTLTF